MRKLDAIRLHPEILPYAAKKVGDHMRPLDADECALLHPGQPLSDVIKGAYERTVTAGGEVWVLGSYRKETVGIFGIKPIVGDHGVHGRPWFLSTHRARWYAPEMTRLGLEFTDRWAKEYGLLANMCLASNTPTLRWLESIGFKPDYANPLTHAGHSWIIFQKQHQ